MWRQSVSRMHITQLLYSFVVELFWRAFSKISFLRVQHEIHNMNSEAYNNDDVDYVLGSEEEQEQNSLSENEESDSLSVQDDEVLSKVIRPKAKLNRKRKRSGRKSTWNEEITNDLVDIICEDAYLRKKIIFTNNKNTKNTEVYNKVVRHLSARCKERSETCDFTVAQTRTKFKALVAICKKASLTRKTASGIEDFIQKGGYGKWFGQLFPYIQSRESAQPEQASEPSSSSSATSSTATNDSESGDWETRCSLYVPQKKRRVGEQNSLLAEAVKNFNKLLEQDSTSALINFFREENEQARRHEEKMMQMQMQMQMQMMQMMNGQNTPIAVSSPIYKRQNNQGREYQPQLQQSWGMGGPNLHPQCQNCVQSHDAPIEENCILDL